jgi:hypothetical protein
LGEGWLLEAMQFNKKIKHRQTILFHYFQILLKVSPPDNVKHVGIVFLTNMRFRCREISTAEVPKAGAQ